MASNMIESQVERYLALKTTRLGAVCLKFCSTGQAGVPDRLLIYKGRTLFVELKRPGEEPRALQRVVAKKLREAGAYVYCISSKDQVDDFVEDMKHGYPDPGAYDEI